MQWGVVHFSQQISSRGKQGVFIAVRMALKTVFRAISRSLTKIYRLLGSSPRLPAGPKLLKCHKPTCTYPMSSTLFPSKAYPVRSTMDSLRWLTTMWFSHVLSPTQEPNMLDAISQTWSVTWILCIPRYVLIFDSAARIRWTGLWGMGVRIHWLRR